MSLTYTIRESRKAKHVSLKISTAGDLEIVVPQGFDHNRIPAILQRKQEWIDRVTHQVEHQQAALGLSSSQQLPQQIDLQAIAQQWRVDYCPANHFTVRAVEQPDRRLVLQGEVSNQATCRFVLQRWVAYKASLHLAPWLQAVSQEFGFTFDTMKIRQQKTLWGSCSARKTISLNCKLLFLPDILVRYVLIHELCHTVHLNHSAEFWALVAQHEPDYRRLDRSLRDARYCVPLWMEG